MRERQETVIDGDRYSVEMLTATPAWKLLLKLSKIVGPSIGQIVDASQAAASGGKSLLEANIGDAVFGEAVRSLMERMDEAAVESIIKELSGKCEVDVGGQGRSIPLSSCFELHFQGRMGALMKWLVFAVKAQYSDFLGALMSVTAQGEAAQVAEEASA